jgi:hypothetical protein
MDKLSTSPKATPRFESQLTAHLKPFASGEVRPRLSAKEWHQVHDEELESVSLEYTGIHIHNIIRNPRYVICVPTPLLPHWQSIIEPIFFYLLSNNKPLFCANKEINSVLAQFFFY